jgi:hypothetical protein
MPKLRESEVIARRNGATCRNCVSACSNLPFSNRLYCICGGQRRVAVGREHTCKYFERKP